MGTKQEGCPCYAAAMPDEPLFTLLARDLQAPALVRSWANGREAKLEDPVLYLDGGDESRGRWERRSTEDIAAEKAKIAEARYVAARMEVWRYENDGKWRVEP